MIQKNEKDPVVGVPVACDYYTKGIYSLPYDAEYERDP